MEICINASASWLLQLYSLVTSRRNAVNEHIIRRSRWFSQILKMAKFKWFIQVSCLIWLNGEWVSCKASATRLLKLMSSFSSFCVCVWLCCAHVSGWVCVGGIYVSVLSIRIQIVVVVVVYIMAAYFAFNLLMHQAPGKAKSQRLTSCRCSVRDEDVFQAVTPKSLLCGGSFKIPCR